MKIFIIDDEAFARDTVKDYLSKKFPDASISLYETGEAALEDIRQAPDVVILDYFLDLNVPGAANGVEILKRIKDVMPASHVILLSSQESIAVASDTIKYGAYDYVVKGDSAYHRLQLIIDRIYGYHRLQPPTRTSPALYISLIVLVAVFIILLLLKEFR
jgi:two-component system, OmpR family, response regulator